MQGRANRIAPFIPYLAVALGMYAASSAWAALGLYHAGIVLVLARGRGSGRSSLKSRFRPRWLPVIVSVFAMGGVFLYLLWPLLGRDGSLIADRLAVLGVTRRTWPLLAVYFCLVNATLEELFWRGRLGSDTRLITTNDMLFAGYHAFVLIAFASPFWAVPVFIACTFAGWLWRYLRSLSGGMLLPVLTHIAADVSIVVAVQLRAFR